jgi:ATP-dependent DNA ligase
MLQIARAVSGLPADEALIDGEAVIFRSDGMSDFEALLTRRGGERASELCGLPAPIVPLLPEFFAL